MVFWCYSLGKMSIDYYSFAYVHDPIISGMILDPGTSQLAFAMPDLAKTNFTLASVSNDRLASIGHTFGRHAAKLVSRKTFVLKR